MKTLGLIWLAIMLIVGMTGGMFHLGMAYGKRVSLKMPCPCAQGGMCKCEECPGGCECGPHCRCASRK